MVVLNVNGEQIVIGNFCIEGFFFYKERFFLEGKCSICGEAFDTKPKLFGMGDSMYLGKIVRTYTQGTVIPVTVTVNLKILCFISILYKLTNCFS